MRPVLLSCLLLMSGVARAGDPWPVEFGINGRALVEGPVVKQLRVAMAKEYERMMTATVEEIGFPIDRIVTMTGGYPKLANFEAAQRPPSIVFELATADEAAAAITKLKMSESHAKGFIPAFPNAVGYKQMMKFGPEYVLDGARIVAIVSGDENSAVEAGAALTNHAVVVKAMAAAKSHQYLRVDGAMMNIVKQVPLPAEAEPFKPLLNATSYTWHLTVGDTLSIDLRGSFVNEKDAEDAKESLQQTMTLAGIGLNLGKAQLEKDPGAPKNWKAIFEMVSTLRKGAKPKVEGTTVVMTTSAPVPENLGVVLAEAVGKTREAAARMTSQNNLKQIALAMYNYHDAKGTMPGTIYSTGDKPKALLSWRVHLLPYLDQNELYQQFKLDEAWDSEHNKKLIVKMPKTFEHPQAKQNDAGQTYYRAFAPIKQGEIKCMLPAFPGEKWGLARITDGLSNTIFCVEAADPVVWTKPDALPFDPTGKTPRLGGLFANGFNAAFGDGSVRFLKDTIKDEVLKAMITGNGGEVFEIDN